MAIVNANGFKLYTSLTEGGTYEELGHSTSASLDFTMSSIDVTTKATNAWMEKIPGVRGFTISADGFNDYASVAGQDIIGTSGTISALSLSNTLVYFQIGIGNSRFTGSGYITSFNQTGGTNDAPTYSISLEGTGELEYDADVTN